MVYGGDGLARLPEGKAVFLPFVLPGEEVSADHCQGKEQFCPGHADQVVNASAYRMQARCPYFAACGGCHYQHTGYTTQLEIKRDILRETLLRNAKLEWKGRSHPLRRALDYRNRSRLKVRGGATSPWATTVWVRTSCWRSRNVPSARRPSIGCGHFGRPAAGGKVPKAQGNRVLCRSWRRSSCSWRFIRQRARRGSTSSRELCRSSAGIQGFAFFAETPAGAAR